MSFINLIGSPVTLQASLAGNQFLLCSDHSNANPKFHKATPNFFLYSFTFLFHEVNEKHTTSIFISNKMLRQQNS